MDLKFWNHRYAQEVLNSPAFASHYTELESVLRALPAIRRGTPPSVKPASAKFPVDQDAMNTHLDKQLIPLGWDHHPSGIIAGTKLAADYNKARIQVEVQFGNMARWTYDIFKFQAAYAQDQIDLGVLAVPVRWFARTIGDNIAYFERVKRELPAAKLSITLPILVIGLSPSDDAELAPLAEKFEREARLDEQWESFLDGWQDSLTYPIAKADAARLIFEGEPASLRDLLPEDVRPALEQGGEEFKRVFKNALSRKRAKRRLQRVAGTKWQVISADAADEDEDE